MKNVVLTFTGIDDIDEKVAGIDELVGKTLESGRELLKTLLVSLLNNMIKEGNPNDIRSYCPISRYKVFLENFVQKTKMANWTEGKCQAERF